MAVFPREQGALRVIADARRQSPDELISQLLEHPEHSEGIDFEGTHPQIVAEDLLLRLQELPTLDEIRGNEPTVCARVVIHLGLVLYAYTCDPFVEPQYTVRGVVCFPNEAPDLDRQNQFIVVPKEDRTALLFTLDEYERVFRDHNNTVLLPIYDVEIGYLGPPED